MALVEMKWRPSNKELRSFGLITMIMMTLIGIILYWWKGISITYVLYMVAAGSAIFLLSRVRTQLIKPVYIGLQLVTLPIGMVVSFVLMALFYYIIITPTGLFFRIIGRDPLCLKFDPQAKSYWVRHRSTDSAARYFNQF